MSRKKLLLADDSVTIQKVVNLTFADEGIDVIAVGDGDAALEAIRNERPDVVLADVNMPGPNGYRICEIVRASEETRFLPIVLLVGSFEPFDEEEALRVGASAYLTKPFQSIRQLVELVNELIAEATLAKSHAETSPPHLVEESDAPRDNAEDITESGLTEDLRSEEEDIESLYRQSISEEARDEFGETFDELGLDDPTIEMAFTDTLTEPAEGNSAFDGPIEFGMSHTEPLTRENVDEGEDEFLSSIGGADQGMDAQNSEAVTQEFTADILSKTQRFFTEERPQPVTESASPTTATPAADPEPDLHEGSSISQGAETVSGQATITTSESELADTNLLELPPVGVERVVLTASGERGADTISTRIVVTASPELVEQIAERVAQKLSQKN